VHLATIGEDVVFLDVSRDAYFCIPDGVAALRPAADRRSFAPLTSEIAAGLIEANLAVPDISSRPLEGTRMPQLPTRALEPAPGRMTVRDRLKLAGALWDLVTRYAGRDLSGVLAVAAAPQTVFNSAAAEAEAVRLAGIFERIVIWLPVPRKCVVRSFLLLRFLQRSGCNAAWIFGVRTWPFGAHCWLQLGDLALDDAPERLQAYQPIFAWQP
jgi:hypothetical protein